MCLVVLEHVVDDPEALAHPAPARLDELDEGLLRADVQVEGLVDEGPQVLELLVGLEGLPLWRLSHPLEVLAVQGLLVLDGHEGLPVFEALVKLVKNLTRIMRITNTSYVATHWVAEVLEAPSARSSMVNPPIAARLLALMRIIPTFERLIAARCRPTITPLNSRTRNIRTTSYMRIMLWKMFLRGHFTRSTIVEPSCSTLLPPVTSHWEDGAFKWRSWRDGHKGQCTTKDSLLSGLTKPI